MTGDGGLVEVQATAERTPLSRAHLDDLLALAASGIESLRAAAGADGRGRSRLRRWACPRRSSSRPATRTSCASSRGCWLRRRSRSSRCPTMSSCRPRKATRSRPTRSRRHARRPSRPVVRRSPTTRESRRRRSAARPGVRSARYAGPRASDAENLSKLMREAPAGSELRYVCALAYVDPADGTERVVLRRQPRAAGCAAARRAGVRLRPRVRARRRLRRADDGRADRRGEGRVSATGAERFARCWRGATERRDGGSGVRSGIGIDPQAQAPEPGQGGGVKRRTAALSVVSNRC